MQGQDFVYFKKIFVWPELKTIFNNWIWNAVISSFSLSTNRIERALNSDQLDSL